MAWPTVSKTHTLSSTLHLRDDHRVRWSEQSPITTKESGLFTQMRDSVEKVWSSSNVLPLTASSGTRRDSNSTHSRPILRSSASGSISHGTTPTSSNTLPSAETVRFVCLCALWYMSSALSSNTGKGILNQLQYPVTLTFVQFGFVAGYCLLFMSPLVRFSTLRAPTRKIINDTLPMGLFQVGGHIFSSMAISRIPVSTVHTIKALSPLFTVAAYALLFGVRYSARTYLSLLPLTAGVMLACSFDVSASNMTGLLCAFGSAIVFVSSNIFFKKIMPSSSSSESHHKLDKLNLLFYSSGMAFLLMIPIWLYTDLSALLASSSDPEHVSHPSHAHTATHSVTFYFFANGTVHFAQNIIAFIILASVSPVTYSIASLIKRVAVILMAFVWFAQSVHPVQGFGIGLTFLGLWMYSKAKSDVDRGESMRRGVEARREGMLPTTREEEKILAAVTSTSAPQANGNSGGGIKIDTSVDGLGMGSEGNGVSVASGRTRAMAQPSSTTSPLSTHAPILPPTRTRMEIHAPLHEPQQPYAQNSTNYYNDPPPTHFHGHQSHSYSHTHQPANLHITVPPPSQPGAVLSKGTLSPHDSYPSPPPSLDSPPMTANGIAVR